MNTGVNGHFGDGGKERKRFGIGKVTKDRMRTQMGRDQERVLGTRWAGIGEELAKQAKKTQSEEKENPGKEGVAEAKKRSFVKE